MPYDAVAALAFARAFWNMVCPDGYVGMGGLNPPFKEVSKKGKFELKPPGPGARDRLVLPDSVIDGKEIDDCAHFISCCIGKPPGAAGGGLAVPSAWLKIYGQTASDGLFHKIIDGGLGAVRGKARMTRTEATAAISTLPAGDLIFYWDPNHFGTGKPGYGHSALYLDDAQRRIACHSYIRCDVSNDAGQEWDSVAIPNLSYTFVQLGGL